MGARLAMALVPRLPGARAPAGHSVSANSQKTMKNSTLLAIGLACSALVAPAMACTFNYSHYGEPQVKKRIGTLIGAKVTNQYCEKYNKTHEIFILTNGYQNTTRTLVHVTVGLRKRDSEAFPDKRRSAYKFEDGNFVLSKQYEMSATLAMDMLMDVMSDLEGFTE
jgi:hypothetical protein